HYRTRLTHSIEVAQIARALARSLCCDEDLAEAVALVHDFGHTPFGHTGEDALNDKMEPWGGFDHNAQSLRVVTRLERRYAEFDGLNFTWETLEGLVKHTGPLTDRAGNGVDGPVPQPIRDYTQLHDLELWRFASLEAQCAAIADDIAYNAHDIDDGLRSGLLSLDDLTEVPLTNRILNMVWQRYPELDPIRAGHELVRRQITMMVEDVIAESQRRIASASPSDVESVRGQTHALVGFSKNMQTDEKALKAFLFKNLYFHPSVTVRREAADKIVRDLFDACFNKPAIMPPEWCADCEALDEAGRARRVADYLAGMTDNYAVREHRRLFDHT